MIGAYSQLIVLVALAGIVVLSLVRAVYRGLLLVYAQMAQRYEQMLAKRTEELTNERRKLDNLVARVLPRETASQLLSGDHSPKTTYRMVSVLFADVVGFTRVTDSLEPEILIDTLDRFFYDLDGIVEQAGVEKIKTIGDAYMCAGGCPEENRTNPIDVVLVAMRMQESMRRTASTATHGDALELRIGINTGQVIAGVVGRSKLSYDIWGTAVNVASRMESAGEPGRINISGDTYAYVKEFFDCTYRGVMPIKNRGHVEMYFVDGIKTELSIGQKGQQPNHAFILKLQLLRLGDFEDYMISFLEERLPSNLYYHNVKHTIDVYTQVELLGRAEGVSDEEILLLRTAALLHDAGHTIDYRTHEEMGIKLAREILPRFRYSDEQIAIVCELIAATRMPVNPRSLCEKIICDADCDYLGRTDYIPVASKLYQEMQERGMATNLPAWVDLQIDFLSHHQYYTSSAQSKRARSKNEQLEVLRGWKDQLLKSARANSLRE